MSPQGFRPDPQGNPEEALYLQLKYIVSMPEKISICLNRGREESLGNDDVSIVCARKYEISPLVWNTCENLHYESVYFKELHNEQEYYWNIKY